MEKRVFDGMGYERGRTRMVCGSRGEDLAEHAKEITDQEGLIQWAARSPEGDDQQVMGGTISTLLDPWEHTWAKDTGDSAGSRGGWQC